MYARILLQDQHWRDSPRAARVQHVALRAAAVLLSTADLWFLSHITIYNTDQSRQTMLK